MGLQIRQYRYYAKESADNSGFEIDDNGNLLIKCETTIVKLGIQSLPGTKIYLNGEEKQFILIGSTGLFEIESSSGFSITQIRIDSASVQMIENNPAAILIIDTLEEEAV